MLETLEHLKNAGVNYEVDKIVLHFDATVIVDLYRSEYGWKIDRPFQFLPDTTFTVLEDFVEEMNERWGGFKGFWFKYKLWLNLLMATVREQGLNTSVHNTGFGFVGTLENSSFHVTPEGIDMITVDFSINGGQFNGISIKGDKAKILDKLREICQQFKDLTNEQSDKRKRPEET